MRRQHVSETAPFRSIHRTFGGADVTFNTIRPRAIAHQRPRQNVSSLNAELFWRTTLRPPQTGDEHHLSTCAPSRALQQCAEEILAASLQSFQAECARNGTISHTVIIAL